MARVRRRVAQAEAPKTRTRSTTARRRRVVAEEPKLDRKLFEQVTAKAERLAEIDDQVDLIGTERKQIIAELEEGYGKLYGTDKGEAHNFGHYYLGFSESMGRQSSEISPEKLLELLQKQDGEERGMAAFLKAVSVTKASAKEILSEAAINKISTVIPATSNGIKFGIKRIKSTVK